MLVVNNVLMGGPIRDVVVCFGSVGGSVVIDVQIGTHDKTAAEVWNLWGKIGKLEQKSPK